ncbi:MAG: DUF4834 family protein [Bacteroidales bacterium]
MLTFLFIVILVILGFRILGRLILPLILTSWAQRQQKKFFTANDSKEPNFSDSFSKANRKEGDIHIDYMPPKQDLKEAKPGTPTNSEDYVDFEEIKE